MYRLFIDEAGGADEPATNNPESRFVNLTGVVVAESYYNNVLVPAYNDIRSTHFGHSSIRPVILHRTNMSNRKGVFKCLKTDENLSKWLADQEVLLTEFDFTLVSVTMDKIAFYYKYPNWRGMPYGLCAFNLIERFCLFLHHHNSQGYVTAEARNPKKDLEIVAEYRKFRELGNRFIPAHESKYRLVKPDIEFAKKHEDIIGLQIADIVCQPSLSASRYHFTKVHDFSDWNLKIARSIWNKYYRDKHRRLSGCGLVWRP